MHTSTCRICSGDARTYTQYVLLFGSIIITIICLHSLYLFISYVSWRTSSVPSFPVHPTLTPTRNRPLHSAWMSACDVMWQNICECTVVPQLPAQMSKHDHVMHCRAFHHSNLLTWVFAALPLQIFGTAWITMHASSHSVHLCFYIAQYSPALSFLSASIRNPSRVLLAVRSENDLKGQLSRFLSLDYRLQRGKRSAYAANGRGGGVPGQSG